MSDAIITRALTCQCVVQRELYRILKPQLFQTSAIRDSFLPFHVKKNYVTGRTRAGQRSSQIYSLAGLNSEAAGITENGTFSISDTQLEEKGFQLLSDLEGLDLDQLNTLFFRVGFPKREVKKLRTALVHTHVMKWIRDVKENRVIAFARATGDSVFNAIIWDVVVDPQYQGLGLGKVVMERVMASLVSEGVCNIALYAEPNVVGFYRPLGFITDPDGVRGMAYRKRR